jgi:ankyrin repeat protein
LEVLRHCFPANLRRTLEELPKSLDETYKRILNEINNANREHAYQLLQCLTVARRSLRVEELAEVLAVDFNLNASGIPKLNADWRWEDQEEAVLSACSSLVSVISDDGSRVVQFLHFSVKEFLTSDRLASCMEAVSRFHIPIEPSHAILAKACLGVLLRLDDRTDKDSVEKIPLFQYANRYWVGHAQVGNVELRIKDAMDYWFDMDKLHFSAWFRIQRQYDPLALSMFMGGRVLPLSETPLHLAASRGFRGLVERLISKHPEQVDHLGGRYGTPLHISVHGGNIKVSQILFAHGADVNSRTADNLTPLHIASEKGQLEIGKWLLSCGADVNSRQKDGWTPLHFAARNGHLDVVRILLEHNVEVNAWDNQGATPFLGASGCLTASANGTPDVVQLLLDYSADAHVPNNKGVTPLHQAARHGLLQVARILLERNADVNAQNDDGLTPLHQAAQSILGDFPDVVQLLLDHNADVYLRDNIGNTPLHHAALGGHLEVARILLKLNAEVNSLNKLGLTPLHQALVGWGGNPDVVRLLLDYGADVQVRNEMHDLMIGMIASEGARGRI